MTGKRLFSLDIFRGLAIAGMILVNDPGSWQYVYAPLSHASWHGLTPTDLVFPFFMFIMGISLYLSFHSHSFQKSPAIFLKIAKRSLVIFLLGLSISWLVLFFKDWHQLAKQDISFFSRLWQSLWQGDQVRILGVLQRLALSYAAAAVIVLMIKKRFLPVLITAILIGYYLILFFGQGFEQSSDNIISRVDRAIFGVQHLYHDAGIPLDPEGLLSTLPAIAHVLIGFCCGYFIRQCANHTEKSVRLFVIGTSLMLVGFLLSYGCPINKKIWSPTFVLVTCGMAASLLGLLIWCIDVKGCTKWVRALEVFGVNPLFSYMIAAWLSILFDFVQVHLNGEIWTLHRFVYESLLQPLLGNYLGSLAYAILFTLLIWFLCRLLYCRRIYIKI